MKLGVCRGADSFEQFACIKKAGFDYVEVSFSGLYYIEEEKYKLFLKALSELNFPCEAANCFIPGEFKLVGDSVDYDALSKYLEFTFERAQRAGIKVVVFGSGGARSYEDGFSPEKAYEQLVYFTRNYASPAAKKYGCRIAIEPLRFEESKQIHTVADGVKLALDSTCDNVRGLADIYHVYHNNDSIEGIASFKNMVIHGHISNPFDRYYPLDDNEYDYSVFLRAMRDAGCERCSVEGRTDDIEKDVTVAAGVLRRALARI